MSHPLHPSGIAAAVAALALSSPAVAQKTWTGAATDNNWNTVGNWNPSGVPDATTDLIFDGTGAAFPTINIVTTNANAHSLTFNSGTINYNITSAGPTLSGL